MTTSADPIKQITYADAGVDVDEGARAVDAIKAAVATTTRPEVIGGLGGFGSCFSAAALKDMEEPVLVSGTDGVGTKLAIAQLLNRHNTVGEDLVAMCVDDIVPMGAEPLFFLDYVAVGKLKAEAVAEIVGGIAEGCRKSGCALVGGEMAEHPGVMNPDDYDLAGFVVGVVDKPKILGPEKVSEGDIILGLPSSGIHSNGYSLVRKVAIEDKTVEELNQPLEELDGESLADAVLRPTTIYAGGLLAALRAGAPIKAMAHITGGGITENLNRALPSHLDAEVDRGGEAGPAWSIPPVISYVSNAANLSLDEQYRTFNMGVGMALIVDMDDVDDVAEALSEQGFEPFVMLGVLLSGSGTNLQAIIDAIQAGTLDATIELVVSSRPSAYGLKRAEAAGLQTLTLSKETYEDSFVADMVIATELKRYNVDYVVMAGYMRKVGVPILNTFPNRVLNLHPALLPSFRGAHAIQDAYEYGVKVTGVTVHLANADYDRGPIIAQRPVVVEEDWTVDQLEEAIHQVEHQLYPEVLQLFAQDRVHVEGQKVRIEVGK